MMIRPYRLFALCSLFILSACIEQAPPAIDNGIVMSVRPINVAAENSGVGAAAGGAAGGAIGSQIGRGGGNVAAIVGGILVGIVVGSAAEEAARGNDGLEYTLRLTDGRMVTIRQHRNQNDMVIQPGQPAIIKTVGRYQTVLPASY